MEDTNTATSSETLDNAVVQGETPNSSVTDETSGTTTKPADTLKELESLRKALKKANDEAASHRHKAKELDELKAQIEAEKLSETERLQKQLAELQRTHDDHLRTTQERTVTYEVQLQAARMGIVDPGAAAKLLDWSELEFDDNGAPSNVNALLGQLLEAKPYLAGKAVQIAPSSGGATNPPRSTSQAPAPLSWEVIGKMKPQEYDARRAEIRQWIAEHPYRYGAQRH